MLYSAMTQLARLFAREHSNREKRVKFDQGFTVHSAIHFEWTGNSLIFIFIARDPAYFHVWTSVSVYQTSFILTRRATIATA